MRHCVWSSLFLWYKQCGESRYLFLFHTQNLKKKTKKQKQQEQMTGKNYSLLNWLLLPQTLQIFICFGIQLMDSAVQPGSVWEHNACSKGGWPLRMSPLMPSGPYAVINSFSSFFFSHADHKSPFWVEDHIRFIHYLLCWSVHLQCSISALSFGLHPCVFSDIPDHLSRVYRSSPERPGAFCTRDKNCS